MVWRSQMPVCRKNDGRFHIMMVNRLPSVGEGDCRMRTLIHWSVFLALGVAVSWAAAQKPHPGTDQPKEEAIEPFDSQTTGAVQVNGETRDWFEVLKDGKRAHSGAPPLLNHMVE